MENQEIKKIEIQGMIDDNNTSATVRFVEILNTICSSPDRKTLREKMNHFKPLHRNWHYDWGFGGNHMWVSRLDTDERVIYVEFS